MSISSVEEEVQSSQKDGGRVRAVRQVGLAAGIHHGRRWRQRQINDWLSDRRKELSMTFNFEQVLIDGVYLPPRVEEVKAHVEKTEAGNLRFIRHAYRLASAPELVVSPPTFLNYLYQIPDPVDPPNTLGLPVSGTGEVRAWRDAVIEGWKVGVDQASAEFEADLNLLQRDFGGMLRYLDLVYKGLITLPRLDSDDSGIVISADGRSLNLGDEIVTIEQAPRFQHQELWEPLGDDLSE